TLEEPPRGSLLVLVCHNASRLLPTVRSRCQRVPFAPLGRGAVETILRDRLHGSPEDARFLSVHSEGSVVLAADGTRWRDAHARGRPASWPLVPGIMPKWSPPCERYSRPRGACPLS